MVKVTKNQKLITFDNINSLIPSKAFSLTPNLGIFGLLLTKLVTKLVTKVSDKVLKNSDLHQGQPSFEQPLMFYGHFPLSSRVATPSKFYCTLITRNDNVINYHRIYDLCARRAYNINGTFDNF